MKRYIILFLTLLGVLVMEAQRVRVMAPKHVAVGEEFQVEYTIYTQDVRNFQLGKISNGIEKVFGPATSSQSNFQFIDGHASSSSSVSFTYVFVAMRKGSFSIGPARILVNGQNLASTPVNIIASGNANVSRASSAGGYYEPQEDRHESSTEVSSKDLFIKVNASKTKVYEQEPVLLTYKVYTTKNLRQLMGKMPDLAGFHVQEIPLPQQKSFHRERVGKRVYNCVTWSEYVMYPQMTGTLRVPPLTFHGVIQDNNGFNPFEAFGIDGATTSVKRDIVAPGLSIHVLPLPSKPSGFSGGVGHFNLSAQLNKQEVKVGDPVSLRVVVSGTGNLKLIKQPVIQVPDGFEAYDVKVTDKTRLTTKGSEGNIVYDQVLVPRKKGKVTFAPVKFTYYDLSQKKYVTLQTAPIVLNVLKGNGNMQEEETAVAANEDIRPLKMGDSTIGSGRDDFFGSVGYYLLLILLLTVGTILAYCQRDRFSYRVDAVMKRGRNANKTAASRLRIAHGLMLRGKNLEFYDEILHTLWGYASDRLSLPVEQLSRDNVSEKLKGNSVPDVVVEKFIGALDECEFERYAPGDEKGNMQRTFDVAMTAITEMEEVMKKKGDTSRKNRLSFMLFFVMSLVSLQLSAQSKKDADLVYQKGNYAQAARMYEGLLKRGESPTLYYNLGNSYFRLDNIPHAVLAYERALKLSPGDEDIRFNLQLTQSKTIDKLTPESEMFFVTWYKYLVNLLTVDQWAFIGIACLLLALLGLAIYLFVENDIVHKIARLCSPLLLFFFALASFLAWQQIVFLKSHNHAIVMSASAIVRKSPDNQAAEVFILHEGSKVRILDRGIRQWVEISLSDGRQGWIQSARLEEI